MKRDETSMYKVVWVQRFISVGFAGKRFVSVTLPALADFQKLFCAEFQITDS